MRAPTSSWSTMNSSPGPPSRARRWSSSVGRSLVLSEAVPVSTGVPSRLWASMAPSLVRDACTSSPSTTIVWKWALMHPWRNHSSPHRVTASGSNWLKWVGASIGAPARPNAVAVASSCTLACPSYSWSASICAGERQGPVSVIGVSKPISGSDRRGHGWPPPARQPGGERAGVSATRPQPATR